MNFKTKSNNRNLKKQKEIFKFENEGNLFLNKTIFEKKTSIKNRSILKKKKKKINNNSIFKSPKIKNRSISNKSYSKSAKKKKRSLIKDIKLWNIKLTQEININEIKKKKLNNFLDVELKELFTLIKSDCENERNLLSSNILNLKNFKNLIDEFNSNYTESSILKNNEIIQDLNNLSSEIKMELSNKFENINKFVKNIFINRFNNNLLNYDPINKTIIEIKEKNKIKQKKLKNALESQKRQLHQLLLKLTESNESFINICKNMLFPLKSNIKENLNDHISKLKLKYESDLKDFNILKNDILNVTYNSDLENNNNNNNVNNNNLKEENLLVYNLKNKNNDVFQSNDLLNKIINNKIKNIKFN